MAVFNFCYDLTTSLFVVLLLSLKLLSLNYLGVFDFLRPCVYLYCFGVLSKLSYAWGLTSNYPTLQLVCNFFLGSFLIPSMLSIRILFEFLYISNVDLQLLIPVVWSLSVHRELGDRYIRDTLLSQSSYFSLFFV